MKSKFFRFLDWSMIVAAASQLLWLFCNLWPPIGFVPAFGLLWLLMVSGCGRELDRAGYFRQATDEAGDSIAAGDRV